MIKSMTHLPDKVANENCQKLILDKPATTLTAAEGVKGKQSKINNGPNPASPPKASIF